MHCDVERGDNICIMHITTELQSAYIGRAFMSNLAGQGYVSLIRDEFKWLSPINVCIHPYIIITQILLLRPQGSEVPRPLLRAELGEADPRPCWAPGIANWQDPVALTVVEPEPALRHNTLPRPVSC
jgi:hypothetical protein